MSALIDLTVRSRPDGAAETSAQARPHLFDALAVASAGAGTLAGRQAIAQLRSAGAGPAESVTGTVLALARCIRSTELDDIQLESVTTAGAAVVPALIGGLMAAGEPRPAADAVLGAMATGYDVMYLAGLATGRPDFLYRKRGWPSLAAAGPAAAATAARVMGLCDDGAGHAMALALLSTPAGLRAGTEDGRWLSFGLAVAAGVEAALAARAGARGDVRWPQARQALGRPEPVTQLGLGHRHGQGAEAVLRGHGAPASPGVRRC